MTYFCSLCFLIFLYSLYTPVSHSLPSSLSVIDLTPLYVRSDMPITQVLLNSPQDSRFQIRIALNLFQSIIKFLPQSPHASPLTQT